MNFFSRQSTDYNKTNIDFKKEYILWGAKGHGKVVRDVLEHYYFCKLIALFDNNKSLTSPYHDITLLEGSYFDNWCEDKDLKNVGFVVAIGGSNGKARVSISDFLISYGLDPITFIHPSSSVAFDINLGTGVQIMGGSSISCSVKIGDYSIINHKANLDHDDIIGRGVHISPGATLTGEVVIEDYAFVGAGAVILPGIVVGYNSIVGAGAVVTKDVPPNTIVFGNPAKIIRNII